MIQACKHAAAASDAFQMTSFCPSLGAHTELRKVKTSGEPFLRERWGGLCFRFRTSRVSGLDAFGKAVLVVDQEGLFWGYSLAK